MSTLIVPCGGKSSRYPGMKPKWLLTHPDGRLMIDKALDGLPAGRFERVIVTIVRPHAERHDAERILGQVFAGRPEVEVCVLDGFTKSVAETVQLTLRQMRVNGDFAVKDSDNFIEADIPAGPLNAVAGYDISRDPAVPNVAAKSFLVIDTEGRIETIIEKRVVSHVIAVGLYLFASTAMFEVAYSALESENREIYMSDLIAWLIRERGETFVPLMATAYEDWGTLAEWKTLQKRSRTYFVDVDGVLMKNSGRYGKINWSNNAEMLEENVAALRALQDAGAQIVVTTCRDEAFRGPLEAMLRDCGLRPHAVVMGLNHAARVLVNDFAPTNPYPSCLAISLPRNASLKEYLAD